MPNLWPDDFGTSVVTPPITILREQAEYLGKQTKGMVDGRVLTAKVDDSTPHWTSAESDAEDLLFRNPKEDAEALWHRFYLEVPALDNYRYLLLTVVHPIALYPLRLYDNATDKTYKCADENEFVQRLRDILTAEKTKKIITAILAQVRAVLT